MSRLLTGVYIYYPHPLLVSFEGWGGFMSEVTLYLNALPPMPPPFHRRAPPRRHPLLFQRESGLLTTYWSASTLSSR